MIQPIPFDGQKSGLEELAGGSPRFLNCVFDVDQDGKLVTVRQRPGLSEWDGFPETTPSAFAVEGMVNFGDDLVYVDANRDLYAISEGTSYALSTEATPTTKLAGTERPQLIATKTRVVAVGGGAAQKWEGTLTSLSARLGGLPPDATHITAISVRLVLDNAEVGGEGLFQWSYAGEANHETWDALNYAEAEGQPDTANAIASNTNELYVWGPRSLQVFSPDPNVVFATGRTLNIGCAAPYSPVDMDEAYVWLDHLRRFVISDGRNFRNISKNLGRSLRELSVVDDAWGFRAITGQADLYGCSFPTDGQTWVWQADANAWSQWASQDATSGELVNFAATSVYQWPEQNLVLVGREDGTIAKLDATAYTDLGTEFPVELRTGFVTRETSALKVCNGVKLVFKRGQVEAGTTAPDVLLSWRDDLGAFTQPIRMSLGNVGDTVPVMEARSLGSYERRQWRIQFSGDAPFVFIAALEDFTVSSR